MSAFSQPEPAPSSPAGVAFAATPWSAVLEARKDSAERREALEKLGRAYWLPIYGYLRRRGHSPQDAEDFTQGFFALLMEGDMLERADPSKGRFRGYLVGALKHYLSDHFEKQQAQKRGGQVQHLDLENIDAEREFLAIDQPQLDPSEAYESAWAMTLLGRALSALEAEQCAAGKAKEFAQLKSFLSRTPSRGDYEDAAKALGTSRATVAVWVHRLNQRYGELVRLEVAATVADPLEVKSELQHLLQALRRSS